MAVLAVASLDILALLLQQIYSAKTKHINIAMYMLNFQRVVMTNTVYGSDINSCCPNTADESGVNNYRQFFSKKKSRRKGTGKRKKECDGGIDSVIQRSISY